MQNAQRVLVVDEISDTSEVLRAVLEPRGLQVDRVRNNATADVRSETMPPDLVVIDAERSSNRNLDCHSWKSIPQIIIGSAHFDDAETQPGDAERHYLHKPYQYAELIQTIERLIARKAA